MSFKLELTNDEGELLHQAISERVDTLSKLHTNLLKRKLHDVAKPVLDRVSSLNEIKEKLRQAFNLA